MQIADDGQGTANSARKKTNRGLSLGTERDLLPSPNYYQEQEMQQYQRSNQKYKKMVPMLQLKKMIPVTGTIIFSRVKNSVLNFNNFITQKYQKKIPPDSDGIFVIILRLFNERLFSPGLIHNQMLSQFYPL